MLAATTEVLELDKLVKLVISVGIPCAVKSASRSTIYGEIEALECKEHALSRCDRQIQFFNLDLLHGSGFRQSDSADSFPALITRKQPSLWIKGDRNPGAKFVFGYGEHPLHLKPGLKDENISRCGTGHPAGSVEDISPW